MSDAIITFMTKRTAALLVWILNLFNPPPLNSLTAKQKAGRVLLLAGTLIIGSVLVAMLGALGLFVMEKGRELGSMPEFLDGVCIITVGIVVNAVSVLILVQLKRADNFLVPPPRTAETKPVVVLTIKPEGLGTAGKTDQA